jgi:predicted regulator of Ras-like GTPase activity (Roadblock/LC7/MglB family)
MTKDLIRLPCGKSMIPTQEEMIDKILNDVMEKGPARLVLLIDTTGQIISFKGDRGKIDLVALGALAAGDMAASQEIARLSNQYQENQMIIRQGSKVNTIIQEVGRDLVLLIMVSSTVPLGWFCYLVRHAVKQINEVVSTTQEKDEVVELDTGGENLADQFSDALDKIWKE